MAECCFHMLMTQPLANILKRITRCHQCPNDKLAKPMGSHRGSDASVDTQALDNALDGACCNVVVRVTGTWK